jgi:glutathione synthase/RimK-type ligase-like ATP-grasp enzyme
VALLSELAKVKAQAVVLDLGEFPQKVRLTLSYDHPRVRHFRIRLSDGSEVPLDRCSAAWWRRPQPFAISTAMKPSSYRTFAYQESLEAFSGLWQALDLFWVNHPSLDEAASHKTYQLKVAQEVGLLVPTTLVTNDPDEVRAFVRAYGHSNTVYKAFTGTKDNWRETRVLRREELPLLDSVRHAPVIFQEYIDIGLDIRVTMVGGDLFAAAIHSSKASYKVDYRMGLRSARIEAHRLPLQIEECLRSLMKRLGLEYGAIDLRMGSDGRYFFLEINPAGQWLFIEQQSGQPITASLARLLAAGVASL